VSLTGRPGLERWADYFAALCSGLNDLAITDNSGRQLTVEDGFERWVAITHDVQTRGQNLYLIGNGASASMASHFAADACKNGRLRAQAFNDAALLTATANDDVYEEVFALPLDRMARAGDLLIAISSSGSSPNIVRALERAQAMRLRIVTLSGRNPDNPARRLGEVNVYVPNQRYGWIEPSHHVVLHYWLDQYLNAHGQGAK
jgi:D-sedoheptulose 7-phosphate isomerase